MSCATTAGDRKIPLPIVDPHHHLWDRDGERYPLDRVARAMHRLAGRGGGAWRVPDVFRILAEMGDSLTASGDAERAFEVLAVSGQGERVVGLGHEEQVFVNTKDL